MGAHWSIFWNFDIFMWYGFYGVGWYVTFFLRPWIHMHVRACSKWKNKGCKLMYRAAKYNSTLFGKYENWFKWIFLIHDWRHQNRSLVGLWGCSWVTLESPRPFWEIAWVVLEASPVWFSAALRVVLGVPWFVLKMSCGFLGCFLSVSSFCFCVEMTIQLGMLFSLPLGRVLHGLGPRWLGHPRGFMELNSIIHGEHN